MGAGSLLGVPLGKSSPKGDPTGWSSQVVNQHGRGDVTRGAGPRQSFTATVDEIDEALRGGDETKTGIAQPQCPVHWTYENGLRIRCLKLDGHDGYCEFK